MYTLDTHTYAEAMDLLWGAVIVYSMFTVVYYSGHDGCCCYRTSHRIYKLSIYTYIICVVCVYQAKPNEGSMWKHLVSVSDETTKDSSAWHASNTPPPPHVLLDCFRFFIFSVTLLNAETVLPCIHHIYSSTHDTITTHEDITGTFRFY